MEDSPRMQTKMSEDCSIWLGVPKELSILEKIKRLNQLLSNKEAENDQLKEDKKRIQDDLKLCTQVRDKQMSLLIDTENRRQALEEELEYLKSAYEDMKELVAFLDGDMITKTQDFCQKVMGRALLDIHRVCEDQIESLKSEFQKFQTEAKELLRVLSSDFKDKLAKLEAKVQELQTGTTHQNMETMHAKEENICLIKDNLDKLKAMKMQLQHKLEKNCLEYQDIKGKMQEIDDYQKLLENRDEKNRSEKQSEQKLGMTSSPDTTSLVIVEGGDDPQPQTKLTNADVD